MNSAFRKFDLAGKTAIVTGGATGLGYFMTRGLMRSGAKVMMVARREEVLSNAAKKLRKDTNTGEVLFYRADLGMRESISDLIQHVDNDMGGADIVICNAVHNELQHLEDIRDETLDEMFQINVAANISLVRAFLPHMRKGKWGRIIFVSSVNSIVGIAQEGVGAYAACKGALNAFCKTAAAETGHDGITVNSVLLGAYFTEMTEWLLSELDEEQGNQFLNSIASMVALGRQGNAEEVEGVIQFLASDAGSYCTGADLVIDGGLSIMMKPNPPPEEPVYPVLKR